MKRGLVGVIVVAVAIALAAVLGTPVRAQVGDTLKGWLHIESSGGTVKIEGSAVDFTPLHPVYLPPGLDRLVGTGMNVQEGSESFELMYADAQRFVSITQSKATGDAALPAGRDASVNGRPATLVDGLAGTLDEPPAPPGMPIAYTNAVRLTWYAGEVKVELFSNLSESEVLKIAESLVPAETEEGGPPSLPHAEGAGGVVTQDDGSPGTSEAEEATP